MSDSSVTGSAPTDSTCWSVITRAQGSGPEARKALGELIARYERSVLALLRTLGHPPDVTAEELKQEFFLAMLRNRDVLKLDRARGRFRGWLRVSVTNFVKNAWRAWWAQRPGRSKTVLGAYDVAHEKTPEHEFQRQFAEDTLQHALKLHRERTHDPERFDRLARFLPGPSLDLGPLAPVAHELGISSNNLAVQVCNLRERYKQTLREVVADTLDVDRSDPAAAREIDIELRLLYRALCDGPANHGAGRTRRRLSWRGNTGHERRRCRATRRMSPLRRPAHRHDLRADVHEMLAR